MVQVFVAALLLVIAFCLNVTKSMFTSHRIAFCVLFLYYVVADSWLELTYLPLSYCAPAPYSSIEKPKSDHSCCMLSVNWALIGKAHTARCFLHQTETARNTSIKSQFDFGQADIWSIWLKNEMRLWIIIMKLFRRWLPNVSVRVC